MGEQNIQAFEHYTVLFNVIVAKKTLMYLIFKHSLKTSSFHILCEHSKSRWWMSYSFISDFCKVSKPQQHKI